MTTALVPTKRAQLKSYEKRITKALASFKAHREEIRECLGSIYDDALWEDDYKTFEAYCRKRWKISLSYAYEIIAWKRVVANFSAIAESGPANEAQARPLAGLPAPQQRKAFAAAKEAAGGEQPTAAQVQDAVDEIDQEMFDALDEADKIAAAKKKEERLANQSKDREKKTAAKVRAMALKGCTKHLRAAERAIRGQPEEVEVGLWIDGGLAALLGTKQ